MLREIWQALLAPLRGLLLLATTPGLWLYALPPLVLGVFWSGLVMLEYFALPELPTADVWYLVGLRWTAGAVLGAGVLVIQVWIALCAPLLDWLGEQTEEALGVLPRGHGLLRELLSLRFVWRGLRALLEAAKLLVVKCVLLALAWPAGWLPVVGPGLAYLLSGIATGADFIDYPLARRGYSLRRKLAWARAHWSAALTFGVVVYGLLAVPALAALLLPACVVGGTDLVFRLQPPEGAASVRSEQVLAPDGVASQS